jgi:hypothetical protein
VDSGHQVGSLSENRELSGVLQPCLFEILVQSSFSLSISDSRAEDVDLELRLGVHS